MRFNHSYYRSLSSKVLQYISQSKKVGPIGLSLVTGWTLNELYHHNLFLNSKNDQLFLKRKDCNFIADAAANIMHSVVDIKIQSVKDSDVVLCSSGSGLVIDDQGLILTNAHVVADFIEDGTIKITTSENEEYNATFHSMDIESDLALLKASDHSKQWKQAKLGSNAMTRVGDWVIAIGSPLGLFQTVTVGIVSSTSRKSHEIGQDESSLEYIQTDCNTHFGNSGGPLINVDGEVIGILTCRADVEGITFAIPMDGALSIIQHLKQGERIPRAVIGAKMVSLNDKTRMQLSKSHMLHPEQKGVLVTFVHDSSPAHIAGILSGDIIYQIDGKTVKTVHDVLKKIGCRINQDIKITILRNVPFEQDWDGRTFTFATQVKEVSVRTLDIKFYGDQRF